MDKKWKEKIAFGVKKAMTPELRARISEGLKRYFASNGTHVSPLTGHHISPLRGKPNLALKGRPNPKVSIALKGRPNLHSSLKGRTIHTVESKQKLSLSGKKNWQNPDYVKRVLTTLHKGPTKPERQVDAILKQHFPQFSYNGDGRLGVILVGMVPDFLNINGKKEVIEVFGRHWHHDLRGSWKTTELGRIMAYNSIGFRCLIIWDTEIRETQEATIVSKIRKFVKEGKQHVRT